MQGFTNRMDCLLGFWTTSAERLNRRMSKRRKTHHLYERLEPLRDAKEGRPE